MLPGHGLCGRIGYSPVAQSRLGLDAQRDPAGGHDTRPEPKELPRWGPGSDHGALHHCLEPRKTNALFQDLLICLDAGYPAERYTQLSVVVDNYKIHKAKAVGQWLATHPRVTLLFLPTYCPRANPIERAFGDVHDCCTRNHRRKRLPDMVADVEDHLHLNGPWQDKLSDLYYEPAVTAAVEKIAAEEQTTVAA